MITREICWHFNVYFPRILNDINGGDIMTPPQYHAYFGPEAYSLALPKSAGYGVSDDKTSC